MPLKETSKLNAILSKLSQNASVVLENLLLSSLWTDTRSLVALMWVSSVFWALPSMPRSLRSPIYTAPMDSRPRGPHSDMCLGGFTSLFGTLLKSSLQAEILMKNTRLKTGFWRCCSDDPVFFSLVGMAHSKQQKSESWKEKQKRMSTFPPWHN